MSSIGTWAEAQATRYGQGGNTLGQVRYLAGTKKRPVILLPPESSNQPRQRNADYRDHTISVENLRPFAQDLSLDHDGVILRQRPTQVLDLYDDAAVTDLYNRKTEAALKAETGAKRVLAFDHTRRVERNADLENRSDRRPVRSVHNDYTDRSGPQRVRDLLGEEAETLLAGRFAVMNTWRPIRGPVLRPPLGFIHSETLAPKDVIAADLVYPDRVGEIYEVAYNPGHRWLYVPEMTSDEIFILKCYDSAKDGRVRFLPHSGFDDFAMPASADSRASIETRSIIFF